MYSTKYRILLVLLLTCATLAAHGWSLADGLFLDDHLHQVNLKSNQWSLRGLLEATTIVPDEFMDTWWQEKPIQWQYIRPFAVLVAKLVYHLSGASVKALHVLSLALHLLNALLVHHLCLQLTRRRLWSVVGALLFVVYSHSVYAVSWLAAQNIVLQTTLTLAALLCYIRASGLDLSPTRFASNEPGTASPTSPAPPLKRWLFALAVLLWCLALLSRENAIVLPVFAAAFDLAFGGRRHLRARWGPYLVLGAIGLAFVYWRLIYLYHPMPDFYMRRYDGPEYILWWIAKLMHYLTSCVWLSPMVFGPTVRFNPFKEVPGDCLLMLAILVILGVGYYLACRRARGYWIWPLWILLAILPVVPIMATPHSGYMPGVGFAIGMILGPALRDKIKPVSIGRWSPGVALWFLIATTTYIPIYRVMWNSAKAAERYTIKQVTTCPPPETANDLFFINLPFVNIYAQLHLQEVWQQDGPLPRCHVLSYSPNVLRMEQNCRLKQLDAHSFSISMEGRPYFSGAMGRFLIEGMRENGRFHTGQVIEGDLFNVEIARADQEGVHEMIFRFHEPLASNRYCFYLTTENCAAARVKFWGPDPLQTPAQHQVRLEETQKAGHRNELAALRRQRDVLFNIRKITARIIRTDLYLTGPPFPSPR